MKLYELSENEPLVVVEALRYIKKPIIGKQQAYQIVAEMPCIQRKVFTDGIIEKETEETLENIDKYYISKTVYPHKIGSLKIRSLFLKDYSYAVVYTIANEYTTVGNFRGWFDVVQNVSIYLKDINDRKALKNARRVIKQIEDHNFSVNYSSLIAMYASKGKVLEEYESEQISDNVYTLKKRNNK